MTLARNAVNARSADEAPRACQVTVTMMDSTSEAVAKPMNTIDRGISELIHSSDTHERIGGITAIGWSRAREPRQPLAPRRAMAHAAAALTGVRLLR